MWGSKLTSVLLAVTALSPQVLAGLTPGTEKCQGYAASNVKKSISGLTADLSLNGNGCAIYGSDLKSLKLEVNYETNERIHVKISDPKDKRYEVPEITIPRPAAEKGLKNPDIIFNIQQNPFAFSISRRSTGEKIFETTGALVFEDQYIRLATKTAQNPNIYGLGEHTEPFKLPSTNFTRTLWNRDSFGVPNNSNLYGSHPVYFEHRKTGTHGVFLLNSNGMDIKIDNGVLEYNIIGGVLDFYFMAGPTAENVAAQYTQIVGLPAMHAYWGLGSHQCRWGYKTADEVAGVIANYSAAGIPLETMWTDIDYMDGHRVFSLDPKNFPLDKMRSIVSDLHKKEQKYIMMIDPAVAYQPYPSFERGVADNVFLKDTDGSIFKGVVWPGITAFPDWFHPNTSAYWTKEMEIFFNAETGVDIDGSWIDMNEPANFCRYPCNNPENTPNTGTKRRSLPMSSALGQLATRQTTGKNYISPPYAIHNDIEFGLSDRTVHTDVVHENGLIEYDVHNLYGTSMSTATYDALKARRPGKRPFVITRSTFAGAGHRVGKWLGDNLSTWHHYRNSISGVLQFNSIYQVPMVGADVCGFGDNTTSTLCARWTSLGAFTPFYRNHNIEGAVPQEPYRWPVVASAARKAIGVRYQLLDYFYTALWKQSQTGVPSVQPLWFQYPKDNKVWGMDLQFLYGPSVVVAPVTNENSTSVDIYLPDDIWYDYHTQSPVKSGNQTLTNVNFDEIPLFIRGGSILPIRKAEGAMTTAEVRRRDFELLIVPGKDGKASGELYLDDGESITPSAVTHVTFQYGNGRLKVQGKFGYKTSAKITAVKVLGGLRSLKQKKLAFAIEKTLDVLV
ncbi:family 31 glycosyl hydrolase [Pyronema domesticum]|uniref:Similar to Probable alpha/beta-glucosidase agdC acc. no. Q4WRH9 n=1 Tax=Pyronema omphalodes (strain CBS 100304) TaxID=1076935 RepID=U4L2Y1_PYROM|nr:family 31 glycosyl hydrolase [Pyronema domesticum]CCX06613.1 Similar to Probable alpha/beta-glucosidase agdC; acc. no. Q4WRH9 [Pyronema omphalodes CBS 100304]